MHYAEKIKIKSLKIWFSLLKFFFKYITRLQKSWKTNRPRIEFEENKDAIGIYAESSTQDQFVVGYFLHPILGQNNCNTFKTQNFKF
jgi:hypothetical protein